LDSHAYFFFFLLIPCRRMKKYRHIYTIRLYDVLFFFTISYYICVINDRPKTNSNTQYSFGRCLNRILITLFIIIHNKIWTFTKKSPKPYEWDNLVLFLHIVNLYMYTCKLNNTSPIYTTQLLHAYNNIKNTEYAINTFILLRL